MMSRGVGGGGKERERRKYVARENVEVRRWTERDGWNVWERRRIRMSKVSLRDY